MKDVVVTVIVAAILAVAFMVLVLSCAASGWVDATR